MTMSPDFAMERESTKVISPPARVKGQGEQVVRERPFGPWIDSFEDDKIN